ncbi:HIT domain-containing protein [Flavobacterium sp. F-380]|uniref:HIT domain-containing protein n=1 Tax=Flavobacterium kayseriense TaxID=2764714 RepID=A0ABR7J4H5_9FLAO|nr:HIT family protein [Flavobacterium kayseriense]MBC5840450.1 HIT domain-containing protein [Flavobacterium kayseriense]MBC5846880.1 HIT domain-containing protein [Flavobacterium kayseriense]
MNNQNSNSHLTAIERTSLSYPARILLNQKKIKGKILDFGCGIGKDVELLKLKGFNVVGYDPFYFPEYPIEKFDTIICFYVLNVLLPEEQAEVLMNVSNLLKPNGKAYFAVRRDIQYEGFRIHKIHKKETYQCIIKLAYLSIYKNENCEVYEYEHYTTVNKGRSDLSPFLIGEETRGLIVETATVFAFYDKFPVSIGHALIVPKRLVQNYFDLTLKEQTACWIVANKVRTFLQEKYNPDGFNVGINVNKDAGQTIPHCHIHIIPRYKDDVENPRGGIRVVIPSKKEY